MRERRGEERRGEKRRRKEEEEAGGRGRGWEEEFEWKLTRESEQ